MTSRMKTIENWQIRCHSQFYGRPTLCSFKCGSPIYQSLVSFSGWRNVQGGAKNGASIANILKTPWQSCVEIGELLQYYMLNTVINFLSVPLLYHSMGQIIKSVFVCLCMYVCMYVCVYVCMYVSVGTLTVAFFNRFSRNLVRTFGFWIGRTD